MATLETAHFWAGSDLWEEMSTVTRTEMAYILALTANHSPERGAMVMQGSSDQGPVWRDRRAGVNPGRPGGPSQRQSTLV